MIAKSNCCQEHVLHHEGNDICHACNQLCEIEWIDPCRGKGCSDKHAQPRCDAHGIPTGSYCDKCYDTNYPYRKDKYPTIETHGYGERLEDDY